MKSNKIIVIASGEGKAEAVKDMLNGKIRTDMPASILQMHRDVIVIINEACTKLLDKESSKK